MGTPELYALTLQFVVEGAMSDQHEHAFRDSGSDLRTEHRSTACLLDQRQEDTDSRRRLGTGHDAAGRLRSACADEFRYVQDMGLNTIRLEGKLETEDFFELRRPRGILVMAGWCCCDLGSSGPNGSRQDHDIAKASLRDQIYRLRGHPERGDVAERQR